MNITKENIDAVNAVVKVDIVADDYKAKVTKLLTDYCKKADIPGFRKGHVPIGVIKKKYGKFIMIDEVNKLLQDSLNTFLTEEKLDILGSPLPRIKEDFNWDAETFSFEFELGLAPKFEIDLKSKKKVNQYHIIVTEDLIDKEVENIQTRYGKIVHIEEVTEQSNITGTFVNEEQGINKKTTILVNDLNGKENQEKVIGAKIGDVIELETERLFENYDLLQDLLDLLEISYFDFLNLNKITFIIEDISKTKPADLDQELFDKLFPNGSLNTVIELRNKIKEDSEKQFLELTDQQLLNAVTEHLVANTKFDLPAEFLKKWLTTAGEKELSTEEAIEEYNKSEKGLRYQLIEGKIIKDNDIKIDHTELKEYAKKVFRSQIEKYSNKVLQENELNQIASKFLQNKEGVQKLEPQLISQKLLAFYKENMNFKTKEISYQDFIKEVL